MEKILRQQCNIPPLSLGITPKSVPKTIHVAPSPSPPSPQRRPKTQTKGSLKPQPQRYPKTKAKGGRPPHLVPGLTHEITIVRGEGHQGAYTEDRSIRVLG